MPLSDFFCTFAQGALSYAKSRNRFGIRYGKERAAMYAEIHNMSTGLLKSCAYVVVPSDNPAVDVAQRRNADRLRRR